MIRGEFYTNMYFNYSLSYSFLSDIGKRENNEDNIFCGKLHDNLYVFAVADGMGGAKAGEVASEIAINAAVNNIQDNAEDIIRKKKSLKECIESAFLSAQTQIADEKIENPELSNMGTTLVLTIIYKTRYAIGNIGDSRIYLHRRKKLQLLTKDHSYIYEEQEKTGNILSKEIINNYGHLVTKIVDGESITPDLYPIRRKSYRLRNNDGLLLCSDGLITSDVFNNSSEIEKLITNSKDFESIASSMIEWAISKGSKDNISVIYIKPEKK